MFFNSYWRLDVGRIYLKLQPTNIQLSNDSLVKAFLKKWGLFVQFNERTLCIWWGVKLCEISRNYNIILALTNKFVNTSL